MYDLFRHASPSPPLQHDVDFANLLNVAVENSPGRWAIDVRDIVVGSWKPLHERGLYFLSLYEAAVVLLEWMVRLGSVIALPETVDASTGLVARAERYAGE